VPTRTTLQYCLTCPSPNHTSIHTPTVVWTIKGNSRATFWLPADPLYLRRHTPPDTKLTLPAFTEKTVGKVLLCRRGVPSQQPSANIPWSAEEEWVTFETSCGWGATLIRASEGHGVRLVSRAPPDDLWVPVRSALSSDDRSGRAMLTPINIHIEASA
jgi:hypothetical protein